MTRETDFRETMATLEGEFRRLRESAIADYEHELALFREEEEFMSRRGDQYSENMQHLLNAHGADAKAVFRDLNAQWSTQKEELESLLREERSRLINTDNEPDTRTREEAIRSLFVAGSEWNTPHLIGADLLSQDKESLGGIEGDIGNPGTWLHASNSQKILIKDTDSGSGSGCVGRPVPVPTKAIWWYAWKPPKGGKYLFWSGVYYYGFYMLVADDGCFSCKRADISARASIEVHQHWWRGASTATIIELGSQHIKKGSILKGKQTWKSFEYLDTSPMLVKAEVSLLAQAKGSGSYAEVNFKDAKGAHITAPTILVSAM